MGSTKNMLIVGVVVLTIIVLVSVVLSVIARPKSAPVPVTPAVTAITIDMITDNPSLFLGKDVEVEAPIAAWVEPHSFVVGGTRAKNGMLVIARESFRLPDSTDTSKLSLTENVNVHIKGEVQRLGIQRVQDEFDIDVDDSALYAWRGTVVIVADSVEKI